MSREVKRVPLDFDQPLRKVWPGYLRPDTFAERDCPDCENGYSPQAQHLHDLWHGHLPFDPTSTGSEALTAHSPAVWAFAQRNVANAPDFYGTGDAAILREATRLANLWNGMWAHHLTQADVDALVTAGRLMDFTHAWNPETRRNEKIEPPITPSAEQVNDWSLRGFGHDSINAWVVVRSRCEREGFPVECATCGGHGSLEAYPGQRAEAEAWERTEPPTGEGWQLWETVSEGSPISPVFASADGLAAWMSDPERGDKWVPAEVAAKFIEAGWAPSGFASERTGVVSGVEFVGMWSEEAEA